MFKNLFNLKYTRKKYEVVVFYFVYTILIVLFGGIVNWISTHIMYPNVTTKEEAEGAAYYVSLIVIPIYSLIVVAGLSVAIVVLKKLYKNIGVVVLALLSMLTTYFFGAVVGCVFMALLTTYEKAEDVK